MEMTKAAACRPLLNSTMSRRTLWVCCSEGWGHRGSPREVVVHGRTYEWGRQVRLTWRAHGRHQCLNLRKEISYSVLRKLRLSGKSSSNWRELTLCRGPQFSEREPNFRGTLSTWPGEKGIFDQSLNIMEVMHTYQQTPSKALFLKLIGTYKLRNRDPIGTQHFMK